MSLRAKSGIQKRGWITSGRGTFRAQGRFTSPDEPLADQDEHDPQSWNLYNYVRNNPLRYTDRDGRACIYDPQTNNFMGDCSSPGDDSVTQANKPQQINVNARGGNQTTAFGLNLLFALSNVANDAFRFIAPDSQLLSNTPTNREFTGQLATGVAVVGTALIGPGGEASKAINITKAGLEHVLERHAVGGAKTLGKSLFHAGENVQGLIKAAESVTPVSQTGGKSGASCRCRTNHRYGSGDWRRYFNLYRHN